MTRTNSPSSGSALGQGIFATHAPAAAMLIRLVVGGVFLSEGIQKFLLPNERGVGRFIDIGVPAPEMTAPFIGVVEIVCGSLVLLGLATRLAAVPLIINMTVAIWTTKVPILVSQGFWAMAHEAHGLVDAARVTLPADRGCGPVVYRCAGQSGSCF